eukprot:TRINITY_DN724_c0_g1_i9.p1 TRINITY_DN724_c0_g1~~TRINITY_DN724_c0_g1_i9.p1  ORF type:complete len:137 (+),score=17.18 TRINITY_DN724_c0_g1_i9:515-925(+)
MSSREQSLEMRTISHKAPPLINSFAFASCCAKWQRASSICRLIVEASLFAFCTIQGSAPSSISKDLPVFVPWVDALDSHLAKLAMPLATWARTSACPHLTIPSNALIPPSALSFACSLSKGPTCTCQLNARKKHPS